MLRRSETLNPSFGPFGVWSFSKLAEASGTLGAARSVRQRAFLQGLTSSDVPMVTPRRHTTQGHTGLTPPQKEPRKTE